jgi:rubredoxin
MSDTAPRCPDCGVTMEEMDVQTGGGHHLQFVSEENKEGFLGTLGVKQRYDGQSYVCPECGLSRLYAAIEE